MLVEGIKNSLVQSTKVSLAVTGFFGLEYLIDKYVRNDQIDFLNTTAAAMILGGVYGAYKKLGKVQIWKYVKRGGSLGVSLGITQDLLIWTRGGSIWYIDKLGIKNPKFNKTEDLTI